MSTSNLILAGIAVVILSLAGFGGWILSLPASPPDDYMPAIPPHEANALLVALKPPKRQRPLVAVVGRNDGTETTDYLVTTGILRRADVADVITLSTRPGLVQLYPALTVQADVTIARFDAEHPGGADYVIVPAMSRDDDPAVIKWLQSQSRNAATIIGICAGAKVVGAAGLLDGKRATTHWYYLGEVLERYPTIDYVADRRMVADGGVATTTGISASMPMMLTLIEAMAGREKAEEAARNLGLPKWDARHASSAFKLTRPFATTILSNRLAFWNREALGIGLQPGMDEVSLALAADAWSRTYRSKASTFADSADQVETIGGIHVVPDVIAAEWPADRHIQTFPGREPADVLDLTLQGIMERYGAGTANVVSVQLEYRWPDRRSVNGDN